MVLTKIVVVAPKEELIFWDLALCIIEAYFGVTPIKKIEVRFPALMYYIPNLGDMDKINFLSVFFID